MPTYRTNSQREAELAWPIGFGSREVRDTKFHATQRLEAPLDAAALSATVYTTNSSCSRPEDYEPPAEKRGLQILPMEKPSLKQSTYLAAYPAPDAIAARLKGVTREALEGAFTSLDTAGEGYVLGSELRNLLYAAYEACGLGEPEECVVSSLGNLFEREGSKRADGAVILPLLHVFEGVGAAADMFSAEAALGRPEVLAKVGSLAVKEARSRDRTLSTAPSMEGPPAPRLTPIAPLASPHPTITPSPASTLASSTTAAAMRRSGGGGKGGPNSPAVAQRNAPLGESLSMNAATGLLVQSPLASPEAKGRSLTAGPTGTQTLVPSKTTGLNVGALRKAALVGEAMLAGRDLPTSPTSPSSIINSFHLAGPTMQTSGMRDFGDFGSDPRSLPVHVPGVAGFYASSCELTAGTTRVTQHPPFYTGHIPKDPHGSSAQFGLGVTQRNSFHRSTNLVDNFKSRVSGYTGYLPRASKYQTVDVDKVRGVEAECECVCNIVFLPAIKSWALVCGWP